jgi:hypothetical protein
MLEPYIIWNESVLLTAGNVRRSIYLLSDRCRKKNDNATVVFDFTWWRILSVNQSIIRSFNSNYGFLCCASKQSVQRITLYLHDFLVKIDNRHQITMILMYVEWLLIITIAVHDSFSYVTSQLPIFQNDMNVRNNFSSAANRNKNSRCSFCHYHSDDVEIDHSNYLPSYFVDMLVLSRFIRKQYWNSIFDWWLSVIEKSLSSWISAYESITNEEWPFLHWNCARYFSRMHVSA